MLKGQDKENISSSRRLAAILFADIVGYTALMQKDEAASLQKLEKFRDTLNGLVTKYQGQVVNFYGDGCLCTFEGAIDAVNCAKETQIAFQTEPIVPVRIGLNSGTVLFKGDNAYGDSVNIASRVESLGVAGAVLLSERIKNDIANQDAYDVVSLGTFEFKNVEKTMEVFALKNEGLVVPKRTEVKGKLSEQKVEQSKKWFWLIPALLLIGGLSYYFGISSKTNPTLLPNDKPSIVILPFDNLSNDPDQEYFSDAMADEIRTTLSTIGRLKVISRSSSMHFKGKAIPQKEIAQTLNVNHVLSGSVLKFDNHLKISLELSNTATDEIEWKLNTAKRPLEDIFDLQGEIAFEVVKQMRVQLNEQEIANTIKHYTDDPNLYDDMLNIYSNFYQLSMNDQAEEAVTEILNVDANYVPALRLLASEYLYRGLRDFPRERVIEKALPLLLKADSLDKTYRILPNVFGVYKFWYEWDFEAAEKYFKKGLAFYDEESANSLIELYHKIGKWEAAKAIIEELDNINPIHRFNNVNRIRNLIFQGNLEAAEEEGLAHLARDPNSRGSYYDLGKLYLMENKNEEAAALYEAGIQKWENFEPYVASYLPTAYHRLGRTEDFENVIQEFEKLYETNSPTSPAYFLAANYCNIGETELGFEWLKKSFEAHDIEMTWLKVDPMFDLVKDDSRYLQMLDSVGFAKPLLN